MEVYVPEGVTAVGYCDFQNMSVLTKVVLPTSIRTIDSYAFKSCPKLTEVNIPEGLETITGECSFSNCTSLKSIHFPSTLRSLGDNETFSFCTQLETVTFEENSQLTTLKESAFENSGISSIKFPPSLTTLQQYAFYLSAKMTTLIVPANTALVGLGDMVLGDMQNFTTLKCMKKGFTVASGALNGFEISKSSTEVNLVLAQGMQNEVSGTTWNGMTWKTITYE